MIVAFESDTRLWTASCSFQEHERVRAAEGWQGWRWRKQDKRWITSDPAAAQRHSGAMGVEALHHLNLGLGKIPASPLVSLRIDSSIDIPLPSGKSLYAYQRAGVEFALAREGTLLADEMGLGKTVQAIALANMLFSDPSSTKFSVLIICPATLRLNWEKEWRGWTTTKLMPRIVRERMPYSTQGFALIMSYERAAILAPHLRERPFGLIICDEAHSLKNPSTKRVKALLGSRKKGHEKHPLPAHRWVMLTGTPIVNRPEELFPMLTVLDPKGMGRSKTDFFQRYVNVDWQKVTPDYPVERIKSDMLAELHTALRSSVMIRRLKADVLQELPAKRRLIIPVEAGASVIAAEQAALRAVREALQAAQGEARGLSYGDAVRRLTAAKHMAMVEISRARHATAVAKIPAVIEHVWAMLGETEKCVLFAHHHDVIDALKDEFGPAAVVLDGRVKEHDRQLAVDRFQTDRRVSLFIGSIRSAGQGLTLTAASHAIFAELDWTPAALSQSEDRLHRIGQTQSVVIHHLVADGSIDAKMAKILIDKQAIISQAIDGAPAEAKAPILEEMLK